MLRSVKFAPQPFVTHRSIVKKSSTLLLGAISLTAATLLPGCVASKKYDDLRARQTATEQAKTDLERQQRQAVAELQKASDELAQLRLDNKRLVADSTQTGNVLRKTQNLYGELNSSFEKLLKNTDRALADKSADYSKVAQDLARREADLGKSQTEIDKLTADLKTREARLTELQQALAEKDKAVNDLRAKVSKALLSFNDSDLQVQLKDGKVYVSLSEQLLFKSGSTKVDPKGQDALKKLATVLQEQRDVNVVVEGHTDDVPITKGTAGMQDNWDLSVLRATEIARLLTTSGVTPERVTASGRSKYVPLDVAKTPVARQKNRRTEIILTPKLDELFQILDASSSATAK
ncbi:OmpA/MotB domain protein [Hymenobacter roseosalivarius DSM 11622]|uniref:OmpA/MotB domain protein n=1 Tax=Hymenobacter roseosalivarius DSM 11622 TaxID=645990 RepID=A0A1W1VU26_9BACT|nr:OmpA/MotB domain protein [Hymenobacter roseosalivarius DSM 11622]